MSTNKTEQLTDGMAAASTVDLVRHGISFAVGILLSRLVKYQLITGEEVSLLLGFLPSLVFNVGFSLWKRYRMRLNVQTALMMPQGSTVSELKSALSNSAPIAVLSANNDTVVVVKETEK